MVDIGFISFITESGTGQDVDGNRLDPIKVNSEYIGCNLKVIKKVYLLEVNGQQQQAKYSIYINSNEIIALTPVIDLNTVVQVQLKDNNSNDLGIFQISNIEYLNFTKSIKIVV